MRDSGELRQPGGRLGYGDLAAGDEIEVYVHDLQLGYQWERREVVSVRWPSIALLIVRFRDPSDGREFDIDVRSDLGRKMRRVEPFGYCDRCSSPLTMHYYPRPGPAPGSMRVCTNDGCKHSLAGITRAMNDQMDRWREQGLLTDAREEA